MASKFRKFEVGSRVKLTGKYLKSTGQATGPEGLSTWTITGFNSDRTIAITNQPAACLDYWTREELEADPTLGFRRIAVANLYIVGQLDSRNCP
jgi:hypothetical protein